MDTPPYAIHELVTAIYEDNFSHFDFMDNMGGGDCDCNLHQTMNVIAAYQEGMVDGPWGEHF